MQLILKRLPALLLMCLLIGTAPSCKKKESGICYCKYLSGDKKQFDLSSLQRSRQVDSCYTLDRNAEAFAGECELE